MSIREFLKQQLMEKSLKDVSFYRKQAIDLIQETKHLPELLELIPEELPQPARIHGTVDWFYLVYPYNRGLQAYLEKVMEGVGWRETSRITEAEAGGGNPLITYTHKQLIGSWLALEFSVTEEGSTCQKIKIGTTTKEFPLYEYVCPDGAKEGEG